MYENRRKTNKSSSTERRHGNNGNTTVYTDVNVDKQSIKLNHFDKKRLSPMHVIGSCQTKSLNLEADGSQSSFSFAVSPSQKPVFIQSVYLALLVRHLLSKWDNKVVEAEASKKQSTAELAQLKQNLSGGSAAELETI